MDSSDDDAALRRYGLQLAEAAGPACHRWLDRVVAVIPDDRRTPDLDAVVETARRRVDDDVLEPLGVLLAADLDEQRTNPLAILRGLARIGTAVLDAAGALPVARDRDAERLHPDDHFDLTPGSFADVDPALHEPGMTWGAAKAHVHLARRRTEGRR